MSKFCFDATETLLVCASQQYEAKIFVSNMTFCVEWDESSKSTCLFLSITLLCL